jgi:DNA polymerase-1
VGLSFAWKKGEAYYVPVPEEGADEVLKYFIPAWQNPNIQKVGQNLKYDILVLKKYGIKVEGPIYDTMLAHYLLEPDKRHNMDFMAETLLNYIPIKIDQLIGKKGKNQTSMRDADLADVAEYAAEDADITWQLKCELEPEIQKVGLESLLADVEAPLIQVLADMEYEGITVDTSVLGELSTTMANEAKLIEQEIYQEAGETFNVASPAQLGRIMFDKLKIDSKAKKTKTGQYATGEEVLSKLADEHKIAALILEFRELQKLKSTYIDALPTLISKTDGRVHTSYNQAVAATGR